MHFGYMDTVGRQACHGTALVKGLHARMSCTCFASRAKQVQDRDSN